jgi:hypothetical protein
MPSAPAGEPLRPMGMNPETPTSRRCVRIPSILAC